MPNLVSNITNEQWLDVISCPRIDPLNPKKRTMRTPGDIDDLSPTDSEFDYDDYTDTESEAGEASGVAKGPVETPGESEAEQASSEDEVGEASGTAKGPVETLRAWEAEQAHSGGMAEEEEEEDDDYDENGDYWEDEEDEGDSDEGEDEDGDDWEDEDD